MLDKIIDFTHCKRAHTTYGGSDRKFGVIYNGNTYMLKFSEHHAKKHDVSTSYVNNAISEYLGSHIAQSIGLPVHETVLGLYDDEIVVGCKDFRDEDNVITVEFAEYVRARYDSAEMKRIIKLDQIYSTLKDPQNDISPEMQDATIRRFWDTFVVDALVGNFDRHVGNWGYLVKENNLTLAPAYDFGSTMFPQASDEGVRSFMKSPLEMIRRALQFPSPALAITNEKIGKVGYYEMLSSNFDHLCTEAVLRITPRIDMNRIKGIIDDTPFITDVRKAFYKEILQMRYDVIINRAYVRCLAKEYDMSAKERLTNGNNMSEQDLTRFLEQRRAHLEEFEHNETVLSKVLRDLYHGLHVDSEAFICCANGQRKLIEEFGLHSEVNVAALACPQLFLQNAFHENPIAQTVIADTETPISTDGFDFEDGFANDGQVEYDEQNGEYDGDEFEEDNHGWVIH